jgi:Ca2+-binding RTX toxin-like protein
MATSTKTARSRLGLETLEQRLALTSYVGIGSGDLYIEVANRTNRVEVFEVVVSGVAKYRVVENGASKDHLKSKVTGGDVYFYGKNSPDLFKNFTRLWATAYGAGGDDILVGGSGNDRLFGEGGTDKLEGMGGADKLYAGNDGYSNVLIGGANDDELFGGAGRDFLFGEGGGDNLFGGGSNDYLDGGSGRDWLQGDAGNDTLVGGRDGVAERFMHGGKGADKFQSEYYWINGRRYNRDYPSDYTPRDGDTIS